MSRDERYMQTALKLARRGVGSVEPNPAVGAVIVKGGQVIGSGWHSRFGGPHAEINALKNCKKSARGATMYVTLEPCCHFGKTPPCTKAIIKSGIKKVVAATEDPTKKNNGKGFKILENAGIKVVTGICKNEAEKLNAPFFKFAKTRKPWVIIKWAQSYDGFLARSDGKRWITGAKSRKDAHKLRKKVQAILVGINTVLADDPMLTARPWTGKQPLRVVLDSKIKIPIDCNLIRTAPKTPVCIFTTISRKKIKRKGVEIVKVGKYKGRINFRAVLTELGKKDIQQLLVEGGEKVITSFLKQKLADEAVIYVSSEKLGKNGKVKISPPMKKLYSRLKKNYVEKERFDRDVCLTGFVEE